MTPLTPSPPVIAAPRLPPAWLVWLAQAAPLFSLTAAFTAWMLTRLGAFAFSNDEGTYLMWTRLVREGYTLYREVWCDQPPLIMWSLAGLFSLFGETVTVARSGAVLITGVGILAVAGVAWLAGGRWAGLAAAIALILSPLINWYGRAVMSDVPANSLLALAILATLVSRRGSWPAAFGAGFVYGASLMIKLVALPIAPVFVGALIVGQPRRRIRDLILGGSLGLIIALFVILVGVDLTAAYGQIVGTVSEARVANRWNVAETLTRGWGFLAEGHWGLVALACIGVARCLRRPSPERLTLLAWGVLALIALTLHTPLYSHHLTLLLFPLAALAGIGAAQVLGEPKWRSLALSAAALYLLAVPLALQNALINSTNRDADNWQMLDEVRGFASPGEWIITDNAVLAFRANLRVPPYLADTGGKRFTPTLLPTSAWIEETDRWRPALIVFTRSGQTALTPYLNWVNHSYALRRWYSASRRVWGPAPAGPVIDLTALELGEGVWLRGYSLAQPTLKPGETARLGLFWATETPLSEDYHVFAHLSTPVGRLVTQHDGPPAAGSVATSHWPPGEWVLDTRTLTLPTDLPSGDYVLDVGLYRLEDGRRLGAGLRLPTGVRVE